MKRLLPALFLLSGPSAQTTPLTTEAVGGISLKKIAPAERMF